MSNIEKIQKMAKGIFNKKVQIGYTSKTINQRTEGEEWVDARGRRWTIQDGKRNRKLILKTIDQQTYNRMGRCRICQLEFEADLHRKGKWNEWVADMEKKRWEAIKAEHDAEMELMKNSDGAFDTKLANAIAKESHR